MKYLFSVFVILCCICRLYAYELSIAAIFRNEEAYLQEWIEYHKMIGVEHFWLYNDGSTDGYEEILKPYLAEGTVELVDWSFPVPSWAHEINRALAYKQTLAYGDALARARGATKWLALIDIDEYLLPMHEGTATQCLKNHFSQAAAIYLNWRCFGTNGVTLKSKEPSLLRLTGCSHPLHPVNGSGKCIVRPEYIHFDPRDDVARRLFHVHHFPLKEQINYFNGDGKEIPTELEGPLLD